MSHGFSLDPDTDGAARSAPHPPTPISVFNIT